MTSETTFISNTGRRRHPRVELPAFIRFNQKRAAVRSIGLGGIAITGNYLSQSEDILEVEIFCSDDSEKLLGNFQLRFIHYDKANKVSGFAFIELSDSVQAALESCIDNHLFSSRIISDGRRIKMNDKTETGLSINKSGPDLWRGLVYTAMSIAILILGTLTAASVFLTVQSNAAAVSADIVTLRADTNGKLNLLSVKPYQQVKQGQPLYTITSERRSGNERLLKIEIKRIRSELGGLYRRLEIAQSKMAAHRQNTGLQIAATKSRLSELDSKVAAQSRILTRQTGLIASGATSESDVDETRVELARVRSERSQLHGTLKKLLIVQSMAEQGQYLDEDRSSSDTPSYLRGLITQQLTLLDLKTQELTSLMDESHSTSPCDCLMAGIVADNQTTVTTGDLILRLYQQSSLPKVVAMIDRNKADLLEYGDEVTFKLVNSDTLYEGSISEIQFLGNSPQETLLTSDVSLHVLPIPKTEFARFAVVVIEPKEALAQQAVSLPAAVVLRVSFTNAISRIIGF